jgi:NADH-quinone oxidoreductase subunit A
MEKIIFWPPVAFIIIFFTIIALSRVCSCYAFRKKKKPSGANEAYACGEDFKGHMIQPDYSQFFPFAFFFTILHVAALTIATVPVETTEIFAIAVVYIIGAITGLIVLLRK